MSREVRKLVEVFQVVRRCDCGGDFKPKHERGVVKVCLTDPPLYEHKCNRCGREENFDRTYPYTTTEAAGA